jgi:site-specific DNA recombinase
MGAVVVDEYVDKDSATSADKRPDFQRLVERVVEQHDIDYVIVFKLDRFARNRLDDALISMRLETAGATLVSCVEQIDGTTTGRLLQGMLAVMNEFYSRNLGDEIKRKTLKKIQSGGTPGFAPLGYRNVGENGRRYIVVDGERGELIRWAFQTYATGEWSVEQLLAEVTERGLKSRGGPNTPRKPLGISGLHRILSSPYYKGIVTYNGVQYPGKHEPLVDPDTWQRVQDILSSKKQGEKQREHHHYLKGTIWCGHCGSRLCVTYSRGKLGVVYPYYFCVGRQQRRTTCMLKYRPLAEIEEQIEDHYRLVQLRAEGLEATGRAIVAEYGERLRRVESDQHRQAKRVQQLEAERTKLLHAHYAGAVPLDLLKEEQERIGKELESLQMAASAGNVKLEGIRETVEKAVAWATDCQHAYLKSSPQGRRLMNQAFFKRVWVTEDGVVDWEYNSPFDQLMARHGKPSQLPAFLDGRASQTAEPTDYQRSSGWQSGVLSLVGSKENPLAEGVGFEPTVPLRTQRFSRPSDSATLASLRIEH